MIFSSLIFLYLFLPVTLFFTFLAREKLANAVLLFASLVFCAWGGVSYTVVLIISILLNYYAGILISKGKTKKITKLVFILAIILNIGMLVVFKYTNFLFENINFVSIASGGEILIPVKKILLPLGISFYTFKAISYLFSVKRQETEPERNFINLALYISMFQQLAAGPIDRFKDLAPQIRHREITLEKFACGIKRFAIGFAKKVILSTPLGYAADQVFSSPVHTLDMPFAWLGIICYTFQIYFDFSGYTDMAIGLGMMFGFRFTENFNFPYISRSVKEFWKRWHMSLSSWFRDYLFLPLAFSFSRKMKKERYIHIKAEWIIYAAATMITFLLCGFWHGAAWNFVVWGLLHGIFLSLEQSGFGKILRKTYKPVQHLYLMSFIIFSWVFFRTSTIPDAFSFIGVMFGNGAAEPDWGRFWGIVDGRLLITGTLALCASTSFFDQIATFMNKPGNGLKQKNPALTTFFYHFERVFSVALIISVMIIGTIILSSGTSNPFLYFKF